MVSTERADELGSKGLESGRRLKLTLIVTSLKEPKGTNPFPECKEG